jgi:hypothetical protein
MSFDPWNGRTTVRLGDASLGAAPIITAPSRPPAPAMLVLTTVSRPKKAEPGELHWVVQWKPSGATAAPAAGWTVEYASTQPAQLAQPAQPAAAPAQPAATAAAATAQARPTLGGSARSISCHLTATWNATGGGKPTNIAT